MTDPRFLDAALSAAARGWHVFPLRPTTSDPPCATGKPAGSRDVNVGTLDEPRIVDRHEHLLSVYARQLLQDVDNNPARLDAVIAESRRTARHVRTLRGGWEITQARRSSRFANKPWQALTPWERRAMSVTHKTGAEIVEAARRFVIEAGADTDDKAHQRLLVSTEHTLAEDVFGIAIPAAAHA